jgi:hypothetical protein
MRDIETIDSELRLLAALRRAARERGGPADPCASASTSRSSTRVQARDFGHIIRDQRLSPCHRGCGLNCGLNRIELRINDGRDSRDSAWERVEPFHPATCSHAACRAGRTSNRERAG